MRICDRSSTGRQLRRFWFLRWHFASSGWGPAGRSSAGLPCREVEHPVSPTASSASTPTRATNRTRLLPDSFEGRAVNILVVGTDLHDWAGDADDVPIAQRLDDGDSRQRGSLRVQPFPSPRHFRGHPGVSTAMGTTSEPTTDDMFNNAMVYGANGGDETRRHRAPASRACARPSKALRHVHRRLHGR